MDDEAPKNDASHLLNLLLWLPEPTQYTRDWWLEWALLRHPTEEPTGIAEYALEKISNLMRELLEHRDNGERLQVDHLTYPLMFFDGERPDLWRMLGPQLNPPFSVDGDKSALGRRWCEDVCATAWRLYSRLHRSTRDERATVARWNEASFY